MCRRSMINWILHCCLLEAKETLWDNRWYKRWVVRTIARTTTTTRIPSQYVQRFPDELDQVGSVMITLRAQATPSSLGP